jgi:hypothetical protein
MLVPLLLDLSPVTAGPIIVIQPANAAVALGGTTTFSVSATGSNLSYQWYLNVFPLLGATASSYTIIPATQADQGDAFYVVVYNGTGSVTSTTATLSVILPVITPQPAPGTTSGTISATVFNTEKLIASAFRRCRLNSGQISGEMTYLARQQLYLYVSELSNAAVPLWCIDKQILPMVQGTNQIICPVGTIDVLNLNIRDLQYQTGAVISSDGGNAASIQSRTTTGSYTQTAPNGSLTVTLAGQTNLTQFGLLPAASGNWNYAINVSPDGVNFTPIVTTTYQSVTSGVWQWFDQELFTSSVAGNALQNVLAYQIVASGGTTLAVNQFLAANLPNEITMALINRDDYMSLPNKSFQGRPVQFWLDKQYYQPVLHIWPSADAFSQFRQLILTRHRHIMDVGSLPQIIEVPQRWLNAIIDKLAAAVAIETPEVNPQLVQILVQRGNESENKAWSRETDRSPSRFSPNLSCYTA